MFITPALYGIKSYTSIIAQLTNPPHQPSLQSIEREHFQDFLIPVES